jgi:hypothetical protein
MTEDELIERYPTLYHMSTDGSWPSIRAQGLLSVSRLLDTYGVTGPARTAIESERRPQCVTVKREGLPNAVVRDNKPMHETGLLRCLRDGMTPRQWYELLNRKSFFWTQRDRLERLLHAKAYKHDPQVVISVDTKALLDRYRDDVLLSPINSGATLYVPQARGPKTFLSVADYPSDKGKLGTKTRPEVVEFVVEGGVPDVAKFVRRVERIHHGTVELIGP